MELREKFDEADVDKGGELDIDEVSLLNQLNYQAHNINKFYIHIVY